MNKILLLLPFFLSFAQAEPFQCKVVDITDGDTVTCLSNLKEQITVKLYQIDAPENGQDYGQKAKKVLSDMIYNKMVEIENKGSDEDKRMLGVIVYRDFEALQVCEDNMNQQSQQYHNGKLSWECNLPTYNVNLDMIKQRYAWYYPYDGENSQYQQAEQEAREAKRGLWADKHAVAPWEWRNEKKK